jgi:hypothetical protein
MCQIRMCACAGRFLKPRCTVLGGCKVQATYRGQVTGCMLKCDDNQHLKLLPPPQPSQSMKRKKSRIPTTTQAALEGLLRFAARDSGAIPTPFLARFRKEVAGQMNHAPDPLLLAEIEATKRKIRENNAILKQRSVNGLVHIGHVLEVLENAAKWSARYSGQRN